MVNPREIDSAIQEIQRAISPSGVRAAVLFGSAARGEAVEGSDIDLLILLKSRRTKDRVLHAIDDVERDYGVRVSPLLSCSASLADIDRQLLESILRQGRVLVGGLPRIDVTDLDLQPVRLLTLNLQSLSHRSKVRLERTLFGYRSRRKYRGRVYTSTTRGRLQLLGGRRIGRGVVIVPESAVGEVDRLLRSYGAHRVFVPAWIQRP